MNDIKSCLGNWNNCPESKEMGICHKLRDCDIEISCMKKWLKQKEK